MEDYEVLGISPESAAAVSEHFTTRRYNGRSYRHLPDYHTQLERGTVLIDDTAVRGFPKVPRTLVLETGIPNQFEGPVALEEKLNGYNVRIVDIGEVIAFTRSGLACPFTTWFVDETLDLSSFFADHPEKMVCGEVYGPENPYTAYPYADVDSLAIRVFDIRDRESGEPVPFEERRDLCATYDFPPVPFYGRYEVGAAASAVHEVIEDLDEQGREGIVMKSLDGQTQLKYTTSAANQGDLAHAFSLPFDYGQAFLFRRVIREAFQALEREESPTEVRDRAHGLGEAILESMVETLRAVDDGSVVGEDHVVRGDPDAIDALLAQFREMSLELDVHRDETEAGERVIDFTKVARRTTDQTQAYLDGKIVKE